jgi:hypothetical protein
MKGEIQGTWSPGYGPNKTQGEAVNDPSWLPDFPDDEERRRVAALFRANPEKAQAWTKLYGNIHYAYRAYYKRELELARGPRQREAAQ